MQPDNEKLIDYLDKQLNQDESTQMETALREDADLNREYMYLSFAIDTVRLDVINQKVASIRQLQEQKQSAEKPAPGILRTMYKNSLRAAAIIVLFLCVATVYKYASVNNQSFYEKQFSGYEL